MPALGAGVRCVARRAGILAPSPGVKKVLTRPRLTACPPSHRKFSPRGNAEEGAAGRSGAGPGAARVQRNWPGRCGGAAGLVRVLRGCSGTGPAAQPAGLPEEIRMISVSELDTGRPAASKACVPTRGIDVDALGGRFRRCAGWECRPARAFLSSGRRRSPPASGRSSEHIEEVSGCSAC